jgi:hypothetical protein
MEKQQLLSTSFISATLEEQVTAGRRLGLEILSPFMDADLIEFLLSLPERALIRGGRAKALARDYLAPDFPFVEGWPPKALGDPVVKALVESEGRQAWRQLGGAPTLAALGVVDEAHLDALLDDPRLESPLPHASMLWDVMSLEAWLRSCILPRDDAESNAFWPG